MCGGQSINHNPAPAATVPSAAMANHARYSLASIFRFTHG